RDGLADGEEHGGDAEVHDGRLRLRLEVPPHERHNLVLEIGARELGEPVDPGRAWQSTESAWTSAVPKFADSAAPHDSQHAYAVLRGMTAPGGGMVAAATLGLPERAEAGRNFDYRYVWLRDQAYAGIANGVHQPLDLLDEAVAFTTARVQDDGDRLAPAYRLDGQRPPKEHTLDLPGYPGGQNVVGNWVRGQFQLDMLGEVLQLYATSGRHDHLRSDDVAAATRVVDLIEQRWRKPDAGVWEIEDAWWTHSRLACVAGLRSAADHLGDSHAGRASALADAIMAETSRRCLDDDGAWLQRPDRAGVDAALLLPPVRGALSPTDPRSLATLRAVTDELVEDGYVYRYQADGLPLGDAEGAFLMCGFAVSLAKLAAGDTVEAYRWFERQRAAVGPPRLFAEEFDVRQHQLRGNLPQAFVHALMLESSLRLGETEQGMGLK
ncbi:MAG: glycoside hydrolase family 15 protein, partial [Microlunatus sp.]|nr:glycoside hydrolase family 15 protein [Microlunatus sp.]